MKPEPFVRIDRDLTQQLGQLARTLTPNQVHLEKPILAMCETCRESKVGTAVRGDCGDTRRITLDRRLCDQAVDGNIAVELGKTTPERRPGKDEKDGRQK